MSEIYDLKTFEPKRGIGSLLGRLKAQMTDALDKELAPLDITAAQYIILTSLATGSADSASTLCRGISYDPGAMTRMLDRLERRGLIRRIPHPTDRRATNLELTEEGSAVYPQLKEAAMNVNNRFLRGFNKTEARQIEGFLQRMLDNV